MSHQKLTLIKGKTYFMNKLRFYLFLLSFSIYILFPVNFAHSSEWSIPIALSTHSAEDRNPAISKLFLDEANEFELWIVWESNRDGNWNIYGSYYSLSSDSWSSPVQLTSHLSEDLAPVLVTNMFGTYLAWESNRNGNWDIYFKHFSNNEWSEPFQMTANDADDKNPAMSGLPGSVFLAWQSNRNENWDIFMNWLNNSEWDTVRQVTFSLSDETSPAVADGGFEKILIAFESDLDLSWNIYSMDYDYVYNTWGEILTISKSNGNNKNPEISESNSITSIICWQKEYNNRSNILTTSDSGDESFVTFDTSRNINPQTATTEQPLSVCCEPPFIVWCSDRDDNWNIYSKDGAVTSHDSMDCKPAITSYLSWSSYHRQYKIRYWLTWQSNRYGNNNIYVLTKEKLLSALENNEYSQANKKYYLSQNYPNPFNSQTTIQYTLPENGKVKLTIFNLNGKEVKTLLNKVQPKGNYQTSWNGKNNDGSDVSSGVYLCQLNVNDKLTSKKLILAK
jgi:hypothetical protein